MALILTIFLILADLIRYGMRSGVIMGTGTHTSRGFTALEILVAMSIFGLMSLAVIPRVRSLLHSFDKRNAEMQLLQDMRLAQATTVEEGCHGIITVASDNKSYSYGCDYVPYSTTTPSVADAVKWSHSLPAHIYIASSDTVIFDTKGQAIDVSGALASYTFTLSSEDSDGSAVPYNVGTLRATGFFSYQN